MNKLKLNLLTLTLLIGSITFAQLPSKVLVGYWENWRPLRLKDIDNRYNVVCLAFLEADKNASPDDNSVGDLEFTPQNKSGLKADIPVLQAQGKKILISIGGANGSFKLSSTSEKNTFVQEVKDFIIEYGVDGIDIDIERTAYMCPTGAQSLNAAETYMQNLIDGCKELLTWYHSQYGKKMILTTAPEVSYTVGGTSPWNACNGAFLPFVEQLKDDIDLLMIQLYNAGSIYSKAGWPATSATYSESSPDFPIVATEAAIEGFTLPNQVNTSGTYSGLPEEKVVIALPTCVSDQAYRTKSELTAIMKYIMGTGSKPGSYTLAKSYPNIRGLMTWDINIDAGLSASASCNSSTPYQFADTFEDLFGTIDNSVTNIDYVQLEAYPNPTTGILTIKTNQIIGSQIELSDINGKIILRKTITDEKTIIDLSNYAKGIYTLKSNTHLTKIVLK